MLRERSRINQTNAHPDRLCLINSMLPPATTTERPAIMVKVIRRIKRAKIVRTLPAVHKTKLGTARCLTVIRRGRAQRTTRRALFIRVMQNIDVVVAFFVLAGRKFSGHPVLRIPLGVKRRHVDFGLAVDHHLGKVIPRATSRSDPKAEPFSQPHIAQTGCRPNQRIAIGCITNWPVEIVFQAGLFTRRHTVDHRHILLFDTLQIELEQIGAETIRHAMFKTRRGAFFVDTQDPAATLFAYIRLGISVADNRMLGIPRSTVFNQRRVLIHHNELMLNRDRWHLNPQHLGSALHVVARRGHNVFCGDHNLLFGRHKIAALLNHLGASHFPVGAVPMERVSLPFADNLNTALTGTLGHRHRHISGVNIAVSLVINRALQVLSTDQRPALLDLCGGQPFVWNIARLCD